MAADKKLMRKDKEVLWALEGQVKDIRQQLNEQLKCLDTRVETQVALVTEIQDYFRRRAEVELEYSRGLDKLAKGLLVRHKAERQKREQWPLFSTYTCWQHLVQRTQQRSRHHAALSDLYSNNMVNRFAMAIDDVQRIYRRCRDIGSEGHDELIKVLHELHAAMKTYQTYYNEMLQAEGKVRIMQSKQATLEHSIPKEKLDKSKRYRLLDKDLQKRLVKFGDARLKALKARNEYLLGMDVANAAIRKYFADDVSDLIDCMDFGFHNSMARSFLSYISAEETLKAFMQQDVDATYKCVSDLDSRLDKQRFLEYNNSAFMIPKKFEFQGHKEDETCHVESDENIQEDMELRFRQLCKRLTTLKTESEEIWKTLETAEKSLMDMVNVKDYDCASIFEEEKNQRNAGGKPPETITLKLRADRQETEEFYLSKFHDYTLGNNLTVRLQSKYETMRRAIEQCGGSGAERSVSPASGPTQVSGSSGSGTGTSRPFHRNSFLSQKPRRKRIGRIPLIGQPKLFGGSLEEYLEITNQEIPTLMRSCIRIINLYGLHHQGIFRVSGAQVEINHFKESFERGEDPLSDVTDASDINSVAGVFKLYLRELREPMFPICYFDQLVEISRMDSKPKRDFVAKLKDLVASLPRPVFIVMRYLFSFLNHLSEFSDENMMDPYNLAICFGPTLLPIPEDKDQVQFQNLVNDLIKNIIIHQEEIFPQDGGISYEKYISSESPDENDVEEAPVESIGEEDGDGSHGATEDGLKERDISLQLFGKSEVLEAVAQFDFTARSDRELSFKKGDSLVLFTQVSNDWWRGSVDGRPGLIPDKYILLKISGEDKEKGGSEENVRRRTSSSSDSLTGGSGAASTVVLTSGPKTSLSTGRLAESALSAQPPRHVPLTQSVSTPHIGLRSPTAVTAEALSGGRPVVRAARCVPASANTPRLQRPASSTGTATATIGSLAVSRRQIASEGTSPDDDYGSSSIDVEDDDVPESPADMQRHLDRALAQVFTSIDTLEVEGTKKHLGTPKGTPDLVMDLPIASAAEDASPPAATREQHSAEISLSAAEQFAQTHRQTLKKTLRESSTTVPPGGSSPLHSPPVIADAERSVPPRSLLLMPGSTSVSAPASPCKPPFDFGPRTPTSTTSSAASSPGVSTFKPQLTPVKVKPPVMRKPGVNAGGSQQVVLSSTDSLQQVLDCKELKQTSC